MGKDRMVVRKPPGRGSEQQPESGTAAAFGIGMYLGEKSVRLAVGLERSRPERPHLPLSREGYPGMTVCHALLLYPQERLFSATPDMPSGRDDRVWS